MKQTKNYKVVDYFNGWESEPMLMDEAEKYIASHPAPTARGVETTSATWAFDARFSEWAWFDGGKRIS